ncbi:MAG TPA: multicopper oxidase domain-containing protein, partial [Micromonosporaceae bacterium]
FNSLRRAPELAAERARLSEWLATPPDKILALVAELDDPAGAAGPVAGNSTTYACPMHPEVTSEHPGSCPKCGMKLMLAQADPVSTAHHTVAPSPADHDHEHDTHQQHHGAHHEHHGTHEHHATQGQPTADGIEWEDDMATVNRQTTTANTRWRFIDRTSGDNADEIDWRFTVGDRVKIRLVNSLDSDHPMHHPFHLHGAGRFLVLARDGVAESNLVWKDSVLLRTGQTVDILFDITNPGRWMAHCHIPEHMHSGMMFSFTVVDSHEKS